MRKIFMFNLVTLDGFFEGQDHDINWHRVDGDFNEFSVQQLREVDTIIFGRRTYELFEGYWPVAAKDPATSKEDLEIARMINEATKIVFSKTLEGVNWENSQLKREVDAAEIAQLKEQDGKDIVIFGSGELAAAFTKLGLIDEYRIMVNPVVLGAGTPLFKGEKLELKLLNSREFPNGNVLLNYELAG